PTHSHKSISTKLFKLRHQRSPLISRNVAVWSYGLGTVGTRSTQHCKTLMSRRSLIYRACFGQTVPLHPRGKRGQKIEGLWWKLDDKTEGFIDLANTTNSDLQVSIRGVAPDGQREKEISLQIVSHASASLSLADILSDKNAPSHEGGLRIEYEGTLSSL